MVIFLGTLMIWIMFPTNTYRIIWSPKIKAKVNKTTYLGTQASNILIYIFPMLVIATLGSLYLHLGKKLNYVDKNETARDVNKLTRWKKPLVVRSPLGIVSCIELSFLIMFIVHFVWCVSNYLRNGLAAITPQSASEEGLNLWQAKLEDTGLRFGLIGNIYLAFLFFPVTRGSTVLPLFGLTSESSIKYHIWVGHAVLTSLTVHGLCYITAWAASNDISKVIKWGQQHASNVAGELSLLAGLILWATTYSGIRRKCFELFFCTHHLYILFMVFFVLHVGIGHLSIMLPGFYLFMIDRFLRFLQSRQKVRLLSARTLSCDTVELNFAKCPSLSYNPTSILFVNVPGISKMQWHPFTITSNNNLEPEKLSVVIRCEGSWSKKLHHMLSSSSNLDRLEASIEGPYGPTSTDFLRHDTLLMVSGGSGITPFISIIREYVLSDSANSKRKTPQILLVCAFKTTSDLDMLDLLVPISGSQFQIFNMQLQIEAYVTREKLQPTTREQHKSRIIWFKPNSTDSPMSPILGTNNFLWLGTIISSSFIIYLIIIGLINRYYIYPIDHNTGHIFPSSGKGAFNVLVICIAIAVTASSAVLWNKKHNSKQIQNLEVVTPQGSPAGSLSCNAERELESLPQQSIVQATNVHYGERPNLKKIIADIEGSSIGVLVSGPKSLRHDVAKICASASVENLHFESISFSW
ncbi:ferric reduction oxidase 2-like [Rutidosis leptorrhynchoides]|uniref:ferric reduction oxidase 2-like n=1 Tax=Rutidosis leptorrhynchoides TaxID=125765 RepID=UPI003A998307